MESAVFGEFNEMDVYSVNDEGFLGKNLLEKKLVHKKNEKNVQLYNVRRALPRIMDVSVFENICQNILSEKEVHFISRYYKMIWIETAGEHKYYLDIVPFEFSEKEFSHILQNSKPKDRFLLSACYSKSHEDMYTLNADLDDVKERKLAYLLKRSSHLLTDSEKGIIAGLIEKIDSVEKQDLFYANMLIDPEHDYFFEHSLDHLPGMMIVETARQMIVSCSHLFGNIPAEGFDFILSKMDIGFRDYLWMSQPVQMKADMKRVTKSSIGQWESCAGDIIFYQENIEKARITVEGMAMKKAVLDSVIGKKELKKAMGREKGSHYHHEIYLRDEHNNIGYFGSIVDVSLQHLLVEFRIPILFSEGDTLHFNIHLDNKNYSHGRCAFRWQEIGDEVSVVRFDMIDLDPKNRSDVIDIIRRLSHLREEKIAM